MTASPRTPREYADAGIAVRCICRCGHEKRVNPLDIAFSHGEDFDLARGWVALSNDMRCEACGDRPVIAFGEPEPAASVALEYVVERPSRQMRVGERW